MRRCRDRRAKRRASQRGFTMIEVLVALAIIAVALAASLRAVGQSRERRGRSASASAGRLERGQRAGAIASDAWLAECRLDELRLLAGQSAVDLYGACDGDAESGVSPRGSDGDDAWAFRQSCADGDGGGE